MRVLVMTMILVLGAVQAFAAAALKTEEQKTLYGVGLVIARQLAVFNLTPRELKLVKQGITDGVRGRKPRVDFAEYSKKSQEMGIARRDAYGKKLEAGNEEFMRKKAGRPGAVKTTSGLIYRSLKEGAGSSPGEKDIVTLHYTSTLIDGREMDSSFKRGKPDEAPLDEFLKCLTEGVQMMKPGGRAKIICPAESGFGKEGSGVIPPNAVLVFDVQLLGVRKAAEVNPQ
uniref:Peptidyl-prolyl cis-trans isomerase n=1 Tax=Geobacter metallireducens TaxID=28232 RepID=A0A831UC81_GEOME